MQSTLSGYPEAPLRTLSTLAPTLLLCGQTGAIRRPRHRRRPYETLLRYPPCYAAFTNYRRIMQSDLHLSADWRIVDTPASSSRRSLQTGKEIFERVPASTSSSE